MLEIICKNPPCRYWLVIKGSRLGKSEKFTLAGISAYRVINPSKSGLEICRKNTMAFKTIIVIVQKGNFPAGCESDKGIIL
jgi:hypothetical protein